MPATSSSESAADAGREYPASRYVYTAVVTVRARSSETTPKSTQA
jgi:hypothetical protein